MAKPVIIDIKGPQPGAVALQLRDLLAEALPRQNNEGEALLRQGVFEQEAIYPSGVVEITQEEGGAITLTIRGQVGTWDGARYVLEGKVEELLSLSILPYVWGSRLEICPLADLYQGLGEIIAVWIAEYYPQAETDLSIAPGKPGDLVTTLEVPYTWGERFLAGLKDYFLEARPWGKHHDALVLRISPLNHEKKGSFVCGGLWVMWEPFPDRLAVSVAKSLGWYPRRDQLLEGLLAWLRRWGAPKQEVPQFGSEQNQDLFSQYLGKMTRDAMQEWRASLRGEVERALFPSGITETKPIQRRGAYDTMTRERAEDIAKVILAHEKTPTLKAALGIVEGVSRYMYNKYKDTPEVEASIERLRGNTEFMAYLEDWAKYFKN